MSCSVQRRDVIGSVSSGDADEVFSSARYRADETWLDKDGDAFHPGLHDFVGGNSKVYGAILFRLRESVFEARQRADGVSPAWLIASAVMEAWHGEAERLYWVHGLRGRDA